MTQRSNDPMDKIAIELALLRRRVESIETRENKNTALTTHEALTIAHGATGAVVGTTNTQTLSNKTLVKILLSRSDLTISAGGITVTSSYHRVDTQGAAATDDLIAIFGMVTGQIIILSSVASGRDVVVKHNAGNLFLANSTDFTLGDSRDHIMLICTGGEINELARSKNS